MAGAKLRSTLAPQRRRLCSVRQRISWAKRSPLALSPQSSFFSLLLHHLRRFGLAGYTRGTALLNVRQRRFWLRTGWLDLTNSESPEFIGRVIAALHNDPGLFERSGTVVVASQLARDLGVVDTDGKQPIPLSLEALARWK